MTTMFVDLAQQQTIQHAHDLRNHADVLALPRHGRIKHHGLHYAKYVGRLARGDDEEKPVEQTVVDAFLVCLSAANVLNQRLDDVVPAEDASIIGLAVATGDFCDACEKFDHLEHFSEFARSSNAAVMAWVLAKAEELGVDLVAAAVARRAVLAKRVFYIAS